MDALHQSAARSRDGTPRKAGLARRIRLRIPHVARRVPPARTSAAAEHQECQSPRVVRPITGCMAGQRRGQDDPETREQERVLPSQSLGKIKLESTGALRLGPAGMRTLPLPKPLHFYATNTAQDSRRSL